MDLFETAISQGIAPAIVVAIYLIVIKIIDTKKENQNEVIEEIRKEHFFFCFFKKGNKFIKTV